MKKKATMEQIGNVSDLTSKTLHEKILELKSDYRIAYRKYLPGYYLPKQYCSTVEIKLPEASLYSNSSNDSIEYYDINSYEIGCIGIIWKGKNVGLKNNRMKVLPQRRNSKRMYFDTTAARILSDLKLLSKFKRTSDGLYFYPGHIHNEKEDI